MLTMLNRPEISLRPPTEDKTWNVMGLDPSLTSTGVVVLNNLGEVQHRDVFKTKKGVVGWPRLFGQMDRLAKLLTDYSPELVVIEGYAYGQTNNLADLVTIGTLLRWSCLQLHTPYLDAAPTQLKKFATGKGNATKDMMILNVFKRYAFEAVDNNEADAYVAADLALKIWKSEVYNVTGVSASQYEIVQEVGKSLSAMQSIAIGMAS